MQTRMSQDPCLRHDHLLGATAKKLSGTLLIHWLFSLCCYLLLSFYLVYLLQVVCNCISSIRSVVVTKPMAFASKKTPFSEDYRPKPVLPKHNLGVNEEQSKNNAKD